MSSSSSSSSSPPHLLLFPFPIQGHINPFTTLAKFFASRSVSVTLVHIESNLHRILHNQQQRREEEHQQQIAQYLHLVGMPDGLPLDFDRDANIYPFFVSIQQMGAALEQLLQKLQNGRNPVTCIVSDPFFPWVQDVANKFGVPRFLFATDAASTLLIYLHFPQLVSQGLIPFEETVGSSTVKNPNDFITTIQGLPPLHPSDFPLIDQDTSSFFFKLVLSLYKRVDEVAGIILNTFYELESAAIDALRMKISAPIFPVGPLLPSTSKDAQSSSHLGAGSSLWKEDECLEWLGMQATASVLYICFGSMVRLMPTEVLEIAMGLQASGQPFLWALHAAIADAVPTEVLDGLKEQGRVVSWSPQAEVLAHPAIGAFWTHCGWNSVMESISMGVPMLCWPRYLDQMTNRRFAVDEWKVGLEVVREVERGEVEKFVRKMMMEEGKEVRSRAVKFRDEAKRAVSKGGSSYDALQHLVKTLALQT